MSQPRRGHMQHHLSFLGFFSINQFKKENETQVGFLENLTFFCFQGLSAHEDYLSPFSSKDLFISYAKGCFSLVGRFWWMRFYLD